MEEERKKKKKKKEKGKERELSFSSSCSSGDFRNVIWEIGGTRDKLPPPRPPLSVTASADLSSDSLLLLLFLSLIVASN